MNLDKIFNPQSIALIGASARDGSVGNSLFRNLIGSGFEGVIYPVNAKRSSVMGVKAYPTVSDIPEPVDLAIIATPAKTVPLLVKECGEKGVKGLVIISAGFKEAGEEGKIMCDDITNLARQYGMRIIGPNCLGFIKPSTKLNASFAGEMALPGNIAFISQSGALCTAILDWARSQKVGFSHFVSIGSMIDVGFHDLIDYFGNDPNTSSILIYMESLTDARRFLSAARAYSRNKPIIVLKVGKSSQGAKAALSHTGSLAGNDSVYGAAFKRSGVIRVNTIKDLFNCAETLANQRRPIGKRLTIITNAGGPGVIATDALVEHKGELASLSPDTIHTLNSAMPANWSHGNPVDVLGDAGPDRYRTAVQSCLDDPNVDGVLVILTPQSMTDPEQTARDLVSVENHSKKTILASWMGAGYVDRGVKILEDGRIPVFDTPEDAVSCFMYMHSYSDNLSSLYETPSTIPHAFQPKNKENQELMENVINEGRDVLSEAEAKIFLPNYGIPISNNGIAHNRDEAAEIAKGIGFPVAMKILSPDIIHKTDVSGVVLDVQDEDAARKAYDDIMWLVKEKVDNPNIHGIFVEPMVKKRYELLIGCKKDPLFGPVIVFGLGGISVEIFKDTNVGLPPLNMALALRMIEGTKIFKLLKGYRGMPGVDISSIQFLLYKFAYLVTDFPLIKEIDINPFGVDEKGGLVLDAKVILDRELFGRDVKPYSHLVISPYPKEYMTEFTMQDGQKVMIRPIKPEDEPQEAELFRILSEDTQRFRFFRRIDEITHEMLVRYTQIDYDREIALVAEVEEEGRKKFAGVVRLIEDPNERNAEFAIVVADPWQGKGLGNRFTDYILDTARERGIKKVYASVLKDNSMMLHMFRKRGFTITEDESLCHAKKELN